MKKIAILTVGLLIVAMSSGVAYAFSESIGSNVSAASNQTTVDPSSTDQTKRTDAQAQDDKSSADDATAEQSNNKKTVLEGGPVKYP